MLGECSYTATRHLRSSVIVSLNDDSAQYIGPIFKVQVVPGMSTAAMDVLNVGTS